MHFDFDNLVSRTWLVTEQNGPKSVLGSKYLVYTGYLKQVFNVFLGVIRCISDFHERCILKTTRQGPKRSEIWESETLVQHIWGTFVPRVSVCTCRVHLLHTMSNQAHFGKQ